MNKDLISDFAGPTYGSEEASKMRQYVNLLQQAVEAYIAQLASNQPRVMMSTFHHELKPFAAHFERALNNLATEIHLGRTLKTWLLEAFFCIGVLKVHMGDSELVEVEQDVWMDPGIPFASNVSLDDFVFDMSAKTLGQCKFFGDMYRIPMEDLKSGLYENVDDITASRVHGGGITGERVDELSRVYAMDNSDLEEMVDLCDIYIVRERRIYTYAVENRQQFQIKGDPLAVMDWEGRELGPYHVLGLVEVPGNILDASMAEQLSPLHKLVNNIYRKQAAQARRQKSLTVYEASNSDDANRIESANDGDLVKVNDVQGLNQLDFGGPSANNQAFMVNSMSDFDRLAGNLQALAGLGTQASTVGQENLIHQASSARINYLHAHYTHATAAVFKDLGHLLWNDKVKVIPGEFTIPGTTITVDSTWEPEFREGSFRDYNFTLDVYSMAYQGPSQRMQGLTQTLTQVIGPLLPVMQQQGGMVDMAQLAKTYAEMMNEPRLLDILKFGQPIEPDVQPQTKSPMTERTYTRKNISSEPRDPTHETMKGWE